MNDIDNKRILSKQILKEFGISKNDLFITKFIIVNKRFYTIRNKLS